MEKRKTVVQFRLDEDERETAAITIQRAWRRWLDCGVFQFYKDLIGFKQCGDPSYLMRYIEPREAKFPPCIYYKVFTHRPVVDMCANSPRDYAKLATLKGQRGKPHRENKEDLSGWYQRIENNGWRLLSPRFFRGLDSITAEDNVKVKDFRFNKLQKRQDIERKKKKKKIEWLKRMYYGSQLQVKTLDPTKTLLIQRAAEGFIACLGNEGLDSVTDWEVDEMLKWTSALNYEEYAEKWKTIGTSKFSEDVSGFWLSEYCKPAEVSEGPGELQKLSPRRPKENPVKKMSVSKSILYN
ncbi:protein MFI isoform X2 [Sphaerodactylus townsendi]|uniref:protein MFI isoform X2 n=1 Tax=Sphaerodactylus townsendi TaxID=933632 RepID=UPI00202644D4|nr:protein MFI isoform X2 [Sphaerodactylus townsendi]